MVKADTNKIMDVIFQLIENAFATKDLSVIDTILFLLSSSDEQRIIVSTLRASSRAKDKLQNWYACLEHAKIIIPQLEQKKTLRGLIGN